MHLKIDLNLFFPFRFQLRFYHTLISPVLQL